MKEKQILPTHNVDERGGFPSEFLTARYVVVAYPIQYHSRLEGQRVVGTLAEFIVDGGNIGTSYKQLPYEFALDNCRLRIIFCNHIARLVDYINTLD
ncbi:MAG: hypothetical protein ACETVT_03895 [bacterium]